MATITIQISDADAEEIKAFAETHVRMMITSTVPARHSWDFQTSTMGVCIIK